MVEHVTDPTQSKVIIEIWADLGCPWCYIGKHRLQVAIARRPDADRFQIVTRSFQLDPDAPRQPETNEVSFIRSHGGSPARVLQAERQLQAIARREGLEYFIDRMVANTFDFHRVVQYAEEQGFGFAFFAAVQDGFFTGTLDPFDTDALTRVAASVGLNGARVRQVLASDEFAERVRADRETFLELGGSGIPFVVVDREVGAPGALQVAGYAQLLERAAGPVPERAA